MKLKVQVAINGTREKIWSIITDIENAVKHISGIEKVEIHNKPTTGLVGLKWTETRTLFGKTATETMWITEAKEYLYYNTRAESHGAIYLSILTISEHNGETFLSMEFEGKAQTFGAKIMTFIFTPFFKRVTKKALYQDLVDIKAVVESSK